MARNKYLEATVKKILDVAERPFVERGNEHTTMADIVESLGGLTKGAVYHHFKKKDKIFETVFGGATRGVVARARRDSRDRFHGQFLPLSHTEKIYTVWGHFKYPSAHSTEHRLHPAFRIRRSSLRSYPTDGFPIYDKTNALIYVCAFPDWEYVSAHAATPLHTYTPTELHAVAQPNRKSALQRRSQAKRFVIIQNPKQPNREDCQLRQPV